MLRHKKNTPSVATLRLLLALLAAAAGGSAWADEPNPYYIGASVSLTHDTNVYRTPDPISDSYLSTSLLGGFDQSIGRQHFHAAGNVAYNKYNSQTTLDNTSYGLNGGWDWSTVNKLSGNVNVSATRALATQDNNAPQPLVARNLVTTDQISTGVHWGDAGPLGLDLNYAHSRVRYSAQESFNSQSYGDTGSFGATYRLGPTVTAGTALRLTRSVSPYGNATQASPDAPIVYSENSSDGRNIDFTLSWASTAKTGVQARLSWTRQSNSTIGSRDFSGLTGSLSGTFAPTAKLSFGISASRDAGSNGQFFNVVGSDPNTQSNTQVSGLSDSSQTTDSLSLSSSYAVTAKIGVNAGLGYSRGRLVDNLTIGGVANSNERYDTTRNASLGVSWAIARAWQLGCNVAHVTRDVGGNAGFSYSDNTVSCSASVTLR